MPGAEPPAVIGKQLGHYVVLDALGSGGMGDVFVAHDTKLDRRVALKLPRRDVSASVDRLALLQREARAAAALNHPNIVHLYSVEEAGGLTFITMELVHGQSLRDLLRDAPFPLAKTLAFTAQVGEGLAGAHAAGVLHRDLKPANVMVTEDDRIKIVDFGVATFLRSVSTWDPEAVTTAGQGSPGGTVGTIGYMSPEQALGKPLDARTDIFALGVMLFEMATGETPFEGDTPAAIFDHLLNRPPRSPLTLNPALPGWMARVIDKALEKDPERRYGSAKEFLEDLRRSQPTSGSSTTAERGHTPESAGRESIVVLPFVDLSPHRDQEYFCHGISEEIINALATVPGLRVISRTSAFAFQGKDLDATEIGRRLRVGTVLEGSVQKAGDRVRVAARFVDALDGTQLWSRRFDRELSDVFAIQDDIAASIVGELRTGVGDHRPAKRTPSAAAAHDAYLKGMYALNKWTDASVRQAITEFEAAIARDPDFAPAHAALAECHVWLYSGLGVLPANETVPRARNAVERALELDPSLADAHKVRALIAMNHDWNRSEAEASLTRALQRGPGSAAAHLWNAWRLTVLERRQAEALVELEEAERLNPLDLQVKTQIGYVHHFHHEFDRAIEQFETVLALEPSFAFAHYALADACTQKGDYDRAIEEFTRAIELGGRSANHVGVLGYAYARAGNRDRAQAHLDELAARSAHSYVPPMWIALVHLGLSDFANLFLWLDRAFEERDGSLILIAAAVEFDPVRDDPRFKALVQRMGL